MFSAVDDELSLVRDAHHARSLRSYRNSLAPVSRLPYILLTEIFIFLHQSSPTSTLARSPTCLHISHVSRAWRDAALQCPLLWTDILFHPPDWTPIMLERARTAPLTVVIQADRPNITNSNFVSSVRLALSHIHHIRHLCILQSDSFCDLGNLLSPLSTGSPDVLEVLMVSSREVVPNYIYPSMENAPCLRHLILNSCHINWKRFSSVGNLTNLSLHDIPIGSRPSVEDILTLLQTMTKLKNLSLINTISELPPDIRTLPPNDIAPIRLEHLSYLCLKGFVLDCANVMRHFVLPRCRLLTLDAATRWHIPEVASAIPPLANIISSTFSQLGRQELPYFASINRPRDNFTEIYIRPVLDDDAGEPSLFMYLMWRPSHRPDNVETFPGFGSLLPYLPLGRVVHFHASLFCREDNAEDVDWLEVLPRLSRVESVMLSGGYAYGFTNAFRNAQTMDVPSPPGADRIILPKLACLTIKHAHFSFPLGDAELFSTLRRALARRLELEWTAPNITLVSCHITPQQLAVLDTLTLGPIDCTGEPETWGVGESDRDSSDEDDASNDDED